jgi:hypothetical protein
MRGYIWPTEHQQISGACAYVGAAVGPNVSPFSAAASTPVRRPLNARMTARGRRCEYPLSTPWVPPEYSQSTPRDTGRQRTRPPARKRKRHSPLGRLRCFGSSASVARSCAAPNAFRAASLRCAPASAAKRWPNHQPTSASLARLGMAWRTEAQAAAGADGVPRQRLDAQVAAAVGGRDELRRSLTPYPPSSTRRTHRGTALWTTRGYKWLEIYSTLTHTSLETHGPTKYTKYRDIAMDREGR